MRNLLSRSWKFKWLALAGAVFSTAGASAAPTSSAPTLLDMRVSTVREVLADQANHAKQAADKVHEEAEIAQWNNWNNWGNYWHNWRNF